MIARRGLGSGVLWLAVVSLAVACGPEAGVDQQCMLASQHVSGCLGVYASAIPDCDSAMADWLLSQDCGQIEAGMQTADKADSPWSGVKNAFVVHRKLTQDEIGRIEKVIGHVPPVQDDTLVETDFVIHDTAILLSDANFRRRVEESKGSAGDGPAAWVNRSGTVFLARDFFTPWRPSCSQHEKAADVLEAEELAQLARAVWKLVRTEARLESVTFVLQLSGMTDEQVEEGKAQAFEDLDEADGRIFTSALWTIEDLCWQASNGSLDRIAMDGQQMALKTSCGRLDGYFRVRNRRIGSAVNVELNQETGSDCSSRDSAQHLPRPAYGEGQYQALARLYLRAALSVGHFPRCVTHFQLDADFVGHCDPRCFDLDHFYAIVAGLLGHPGTTRYGVAPTYGTRWGKYSVWWDTEVCGGPPPR